MKRLTSIFSTLAIIISLVAILITSIKHSELHKHLQNSESVTPQSYFSETTVKYPVDANYVSSPIKYEDTAQETTKTFSIPVEKGQIAIVGGYEVDGISGGVYLVLGPGDHTIAIRNGFYVIVSKDDAQNEFNFRLNQALEYGWLDGSDEEIK